MKQMEKEITYKIQNYLIQSFFYIFSKINPKLSSFLVGKIFCSAHFLLPLNKIVHRNLDIAFPELEKQKKQFLKKKIWENLGKNFGELPHLKAIQPNIKIMGRNHLYTAKESDRPVIFVSAHFGNWEFLPGLLAQEGLPFSPIFRAPNNPYLNEFLIQIRKNMLPKNTPIFTKGAKDIRKILAHLKSGKHLGMLIDQKMNDGIALRFFNQRAMSSNAAVSLALKTNALIISGRMERNRNGDLSLIVDPPIDLSKHASTKKSFIQIKECSQFLNHRIEKWIVENPVIWLWMHRRWDKSLYKCPTFHRRRS